MAKSGCADCHEWRKQCEILKGKRDEIYAQVKKLEGSLGAARFKSQQARRVAALILWFCVHPPERRDPWFEAYPWLAESLHEIMAKGDRRPAASPDELPPPPEIREYRVDPASPDAVPYPVEGMEPTMPDEEYQQAVQEIHKRRGSIFE